MAGKTVQPPPSGKHQKPEPKGDPDKTQRIKAHQHALDVNDAYTDGVPSKNKHHRKDGA